MGIDIGIKVALIIGLWRDLPCFRNAKIKKIFQGLFIHAITHTIIKLPSVVLFFRAKKKKALYCVTVMWTHPSPLSYPFANMLWQGSRLFVARILRDDVWTTNWQSIFLVLCRREPLRAPRETLIESPACKLQHLGATGREWERAAGGEVRHHSAADHRRGKNHRIYFSLY